MPFIPTADCLKVTMKYVSDGDMIAENVFHVNTVIPDSPTERDFIANIFKDWYDSEYKPLVTANWQLDQVITQDITIEEGTGSVLEVGIVGTNGGSASANNVSTTITWLTGLAGKSARGRSFLLPPPTSAVLERSITTGYQTSLQTAAGVLIASLATGANDMQVVSYVSGGVPRAAGRKLTVTSSVVHGRVTSQRGRLN